MKRLTLVIMAVLVFSACSNDQEPTVSPTSPGTTPTSPSPSPTGQATGTVNVASSSLGDILVDADGRTLYLFMRDSGGMSSCYEACATNWPALVVTTAPQAGAGVNASLLRTTQRTGGEMQVTYNDHPLYRFSNDASPGDTNGQGVGENWFVVSPAGEPIQS